MAELTDSDLDALTLAAEANITRVETSILTELVAEVRQHRAGRKIDARILDIQPHPDQATNNPSCWAVRFEISYDDDTRTFWRWHSAYKMKGGQRIYTDEKPRAMDILKRFWDDTFGDLHGFNFLDGLISRPDQIRKIQPHETTMAKKTPKNATKKKPARGRAITKKTKKATRPTRQPQKTPTTSGGAIVTGTDPCVCGDAPEEHGRDPKYPGSTACRNCTTCYAYEAEVNDTEAEDA